MTEAAIFAKPDRLGGKFRLADSDGDLLIIEPTRVETDVSTQYGTGDAVSATIYVVDGVHADTTYPDVRIFSKGLVNQLRKRIGQRVLARLGHGEAADGYSAPWQLLDPTEAEATFAAEWWNSQQSNQWGADQTVRF